VNKFARTVTFLQNKGILQEFTKLFDYIYVRVVRDSARKFPQFSFFTDQIFAYLFEACSDSFKVEEIKVTLVILEEVHLFFELVQFF
jgi:uracil phosphoribosyltransferase